MGSCLTGVHKHKGRKLSDSNGKKKGDVTFMTECVVIYVSVGCASFLLTEICCLGESRDMGERKGKGIGGWREANVDDVNLM
jgi:hypothetical protein